MVVNTERINDSAKKELSRLGENSSFNFSTGTSDQLNVQDLNPFDLVFLTNYRSMSNGQVQQLAKFVSDGGKLIPKLYIQMPRFRHRGPGMAPFLAPTGDQQQADVTSPSTRTALELRGQLLLRLPKLALESSSRSVQPGPHGPQSLRFRNRRGRSAGCGDTRTGPWKPQ